MELLYDYKITAIVDGSEEVIRIIEDRISFFIVLRYRFPGEWHVINNC